MMSTGLLHYFCLILACVSHAAAIGMSIPPVVIGDKKHYSSLRNLVNCISYTTSNDDIIMLHVDSGGKLNSQKLNLRVFDSEDNTLRSMEDMVDESIIIFTNLNNPVQIPQSDSEERIGLSNRRELKEINDEVRELGKSQIHICFDNVYYDKSWSFQKRTRDVRVKVTIRNITTLKQTNYNNYAKHFVRIPNGGVKESEDLTDSTSEFTENDFNTAVHMLQTSLNEVSEELKSSEGTLQTLKSLESELRNVNESIFESFTFTSLMIISTILAFGLAQLAYFRIYLKRRRFL